MFDIAERFGITFGNQLAITPLESSVRRSLMYASSSACVTLGVECQELRGEVTQFGFTQLFRCLHEHVDRDTGYAITRPS
jgi:hypothetical protein